MASETEPRCKADVWHGYHSATCSRAAKRDGFCNQHHPDAEAKRDAAARERHDRRLAASPAAEVARLRAEVERLRGLVARAVPGIRAGGGARAPDWLAEADALLTREPTDD